MIQSLHKYGLLSASVFFILMVLIGCQRENSLQIEFVSEGAGIAPGIGRYSKELEKKLALRQEELGPSYKARTRHKLDSGQPKYTNRLFLETSPYLLQHAHNPVNWFPWGDEAFELAAQLNRPVFLSVGYSTCHWCHVMEEESFEDEEIAKYMNENYIAIKVDREERPDIDSIYMAAVQAITGRGGWPMSVWLHSDRRAFYGGTYFPARDGDRGSRYGFLTLLKGLKERFDEDAEKINASSEKILNLVRKMKESATPTNFPDEDVLKAAIESYSKAFDPKYGGLKGRTKFPSSLSIALLLRYSSRKNSKWALEMAELTLKKMASGGMYDQVAGGFHRYSTDETWLVPHFEKMLYDNALLVSAYVEAYQLTQNKFYRFIADDILRYVLREMRSPQAVFYSATDADSITPAGHREEGYFFTWTTSELESFLTPLELKLAVDSFGISLGGNFEGRNILVRNSGLEPDSEALKSLREKMRQERAKRDPPLRDDKIITAWNALMISALAKAAFAFSDEIYTKAAVTAADQLLSNHFIEGRLRRTSRNSKARLNAYLEDYAFLIAACLDLFELTHDLKWWQRAVDLDTVLLNQYEDKEHGAYYRTSHDHEQLLVREKPDYDGAIPSGNSVQLLNLQRLYHFSLNEAYRMRFEKAFKNFGESLSSRPTALSEMLTAVDFFYSKPKEIIIIGDTTKETEPFVSVLRSSFFPHRVLIVSASSQTSDKDFVLKSVGLKRKLNGKPTAYVCEQGLCKKPTTEVAEFRRQLKD